MTKLHELLAAEKTPNAAWNQLHEETLKKFKAPAHYFEGYSRSLSMIEDTPQNKVIEDEAKEEKPVTTTVYDTLEYALRIYGRAENLQYQKNKTNQSAVGTVMWHGEELLKDMPVDQLLGLESRLGVMRRLIETIPTIEATKHWVSSTTREHCWETQFPEVTTKTEKQLVPVILAEATKEHKAQVQSVNRDVFVGKVTTIKRSGAATALQKANALNTIDNLIVEIKQARMRANETEVEDSVIADKLIELILQPFTE